MAILFLEFNFASLFEENVITAVHEETEKPSYDYHLYALFESLALVLVNRAPESLIVIIRCLTP
jgi:hypothetical protein